MDVVVRHAGGMAFVGYGPSGHFTVMDGHEPGSDEPQRAPGPMEMLLIALGGCTGMDVVSILHKKRVPFTGVELRIHGERAPEHPRRYTSIEIEYVVRGSALPRKPVEDAARLSFEKYCSVAATLKAGTRLTYRVTLEEPAVHGAAPGGATTGVERAAPAASLPPAEGGAGPQG
ncbi:OsmC family protein [Carboxydochorda subterranea]|uniref:OsmC family protein n=1 Tax=Carboxydichorda subterranea TaxID=3109565 RepID=A0ABZ1C1Q2_9FIRM|nr:OsmC family protein [Limnochorda sp. L945t]WRP18902.1 OsmC family protein [Limnochorda sp. L945t]